MSVNYVDTYIRNLPKYVARAITMQSEKKWQSRHDYLYRELLRDFDSERKPPMIATSMTGDPATWRYIDFDPYEAWLGRRDKSLLELRVETWDCAGDTFNHRFKEEE